MAVHPIRPLMTRDVRTHLPPRLYGIVWATDSVAALRWSRHFPHCDKRNVVLPSPLLLSVLPGRGARLSAETKLGALAPTLEDDIEHRHHENADRAGRQHAAEHRGTDRATADLGRTGCEHQRHETENEGDRRHHDRAETHLRSQRR